ncbi:MAG: nucleotidyltransferase family protein [Planctomycetota bacterium]
MLAALRRRVERVRREREDVVAVGCFGSYARGDWGVGSDLDLVIIIEDSDEPFERRYAQWNLDDLPVPADVLTYTLAEWDAMDPSSRFRARLDREAQWL